MILHRHWPTAEEIEVLRPAKNAGLRMTGLLGVRNLSGDATEIKIPTLSPKAREGWGIRISQGHG